MEVAYRNYLFSKSPWNTAVAVAGIKAADRAPDAKIGMALRKRILDETDVPNYAQVSRALEKIKYSKAPNNDDKFNKAVRIFKESLVPMKFRGEVGKSMRIAHLDGIARG